MKKLLILLSLLVLALFVVSCAPKEGAEGEEEASEGVALAGQAVATDSFCKRGEKCGFITGVPDVKGKIICGKVAEMQGFNENNDPTEIIGNQACSDAGYDVCVGVHQGYTSKFYASTNESCVGLQYLEADATWWPCDYKLKKVVNSGCGFISDSLGEKGGDVEPRYGDGTQISTLYYALCCKFIKE